MAKDWEEEVLRIAGEANSIPFVKLLQESMTIMLAAGQMAMMADTNSNGVGVGPGVTVTHASATTEAVSEETNTNLIPVDEEAAPAIPPGETTETKKEDEERVDVNTATE